VEPVPPPIFFASGTSFAGHAFMSLGTVEQHSPFTRPSPNHAKEHAMNWDQIEGNWKQVTGKVRETWGKLTDDDFEQIAGKRDQLIGTIQKRYGIAKEEAEKQVKRFEDTMH
jgi:uncharacterized protein YjbJ (UPF0337 family)